jgi:hypothetical protein
MTQYLQFCLGFSPLKTGLGIAPIAAVLLVVAPMSALIVRRVGTKPVVAGGLLLIALGLGLLSGTSVHDTYGDAFPWFVLIGLGVGLTMAPSTESIMGSLPKEEAGVGSATSDTSMQVGGALGVGILGTALNLRYQNLMTPVLSHLPIPANINAVILGSVGGALAVAHRVPGPAGDALSSSATGAFISGMNLGLLVASVAVGLAAIVVLALLPSRAHA